MKPQKTGGRIMSVRRQCNRYRTEPCGEDKNDVIKRAKRFFGNDCFLIRKLHENGIWHSQRLSLPPFKNPDGAEYFRKVSGRWQKCTEAEAMNWQYGL